MTEIDDLDQLSRDQLAAAVEAALEAKDATESYQPAHRRQAVEQEYHDAMLDVDRLCELYEVDFGDDLGLLAEDLGLDDLEVPSPDESDLADLRYDQDRAWARDELELGGYGD